MMASIWDYITRDRNTRGFSETKGGQVFNDAMQELVDIMQPPDVDRSTINKNAIMQDMLYLSPLGKGLRALDGLAPGYEATVGGASGILSNELEKLGMSESSSDRLNRDLLALGLEAPVDMFLAPYAGVAQKAGEFSGMAKRARPYLLGETLETNPDINMVGKPGKPSAVRIDDERFSSREIAEIKKAEEKY